MNMHAVDIFLLSYDDLKGLPITSFFERIHINVSVDKQPEFEH